MGGEGSVPVCRVASIHEFMEGCESPILRSTAVNPKCRGSISGRFPIQQNSRTPAEVLATSARLHGKRPYLGERIIDINGNYGSYKFISFSDALSQTQTFAKGLSTIGVTKGSYVGLFSDNCALWQISFFAINMLQAISILVSDSLALERTFSIFNETKCSIMIVSKDKFETLMKYLPNMPHVKKVIILNSEIPLENPHPEVNFYSYNSLSKSAATVEYKFGQQNPDDDAVIIFTTGTTDKPKGCILSNSNLIAGASGFSDLAYSIGYGDYYISYMPLTHIYSLNVELCMLAQGAAIGYYTGSTKNLLEDIKVLRPTIICGYPRLWNKICNSIKEYIDNCSFLEKYLYKLTISHKHHAFNNNPNPSILLDNLILPKVNSFLGSRVRLIVSGGAPLKPDVYDYLRAVITPNIVQGYGMTESSGCISVQDPRMASNIGSGIISPCCEVKLRSVPGMMYNPQGKPRTGEILVRGPNVFKGYFNDEKSTKEVLLEGGWLCTSDIGLITESGEIQIIDRISNFIKLSSGRYISIQTMTSIMESVEGVKGAYVYADSHSDKPIAVISPSKLYATLWKGKGIKDLSRCEEACDEMKNRINKRMEQLHCSKCNLLSKVIIIEDEISHKFDPNNPCQLQYNDIRKLYQDRILECL